MAEYQKTLTVYLDIMGFKKLIDQSALHSGKVSAILDILKKTKEQASRSHNRQIAYRHVIDITESWNFSDLVVRATPLELGLELIEAIAVEFSILPAIQCQLFLESGILLRGAICVDGLYTEKDIIFGPALVRAYQLAEKVAVFPRIVIDPKSCRLQRSKESAEIMAMIDGFIMRGDDGVYFIDYLYPVYKKLYLECRGSFHACLFSTDTKQLLSLHKTQVENKLRELSDADDRTKQKGLWLALYHNSVVQRLMKESPAKNHKLKGLLISKAQLQI